MKLKNVVVLVTGAGQGIGAAIATRFADEGARVVVNDINDEQGQATTGTICAAGGEAVYVRGDVSRSAEVRVMIAQTIEQFGQLNHLVNNAAYGHGGGKPAHELGEQEWDRVLDVCLKGAFLCAKYAIPEIIKAGGGSIINIASIAGCFGFPNDTAYLAAKGGLLQLTKALAIDYAAHNVRANAISPGWTATPINAEIRNNPEK
jgi:NAD(P)-dependent dehydrogenase (short-subunit alcohol dehydrogenase family)